MQEASVEQYHLCKNQLQQNQGDIAALRSLLGSQADGGRGFVGQLQEELRLAFARAQLDEAERLGKLVGTALWARNPDGRSHQVHRQSLPRLLAGVRAVLDGTVLPGIAQLEKAAESADLSDSLRWVARFWTARGAGASGDLNQGYAAASQALVMSRKLDPCARALSLTQLAELEYLRGAGENALPMLEAAAMLFSELGDMWGEASSHLTRARIEEATGMRREATASALRARDAAPAWEEPVLFLAHQALTVGDTAHCRAVLRPLVQDGNASRKVRQELRLIELYESKTVPPGAMAAYCSIRDLPPDDDVLARLEPLAEMVPTFLQLRELLAWSLLKLGRDEAAQQHFRSLSEQSLDPDLQSSVLLGLGCLASRRDGACGTAPLVSRSIEMKFNFDDELNKLSEDGELDEEATSGGRPAPPADQSVVKSAFTGELQQLPVPDLIEFLKSSRRSGTMVISSEIGVGAIYLNKGKVTCAAAPHVDTLGVALEKAGLLTAAQLQAAMDAQAHCEQRLASVLVDKAFVSHDEMRRMLARQATDVILELLGWASGRFAFEPRGPTIPDHEDLELDAQQLLLDALRQFDEINR